MQSFIVPIFKSGDKNNHTNYRTFMINPILVKMYIMILEKKVSIWLESHNKIDKGQVGFRRYHSIWTKLLHLGSLQRSVTIIKLVSFVVTLTLEKILTQCQGQTFGIGWKS
jgi:hypothetical protein